MVEMTMAGSQLWVEGVGIEEREKAEKRVRAPLFVEVEGRVFDLLLFSCLFFSPLSSLSKQACLTPTLISRHREQFFLSQKVDAEQIKGSRVG